MDDAQRQALKKAKRRFSKRFFLTAQNVGIVEGDPTHPPITLTGVTSTVSCAADYAERNYRCPKGEAAILVEWIPTGLVCDSGGNELRIDYSLIPPDRKTWATFPKTFKGFPVYYARKMSVATAR